MVLDEVLHDYTVYKYVLLYMYLFLAGSISGYIIEVLYRRFVSVKRWVNPGFNKGPWIPLYGCGVVVMSAITTSFVALFHSNGIALYNPYDLYGTGVGSGPTPYDLIPILIMGVGMTLLELVAGLIFVKGFKVRLWDYSNDKHNFMGIICPLFSVIWIVVAILFYYCLSPFITHKAQQDVASILMLNDYGGFPKVHIILILGIVYGFLIYDFVQSMGLFGRVSKIAKKIGGIIHYDEFNDDRARFNHEALSQIDQMLPDKLKEALEKLRARDQKKTISYRIRRFLYIDPDKKDNNFDEQGRPICDENIEKDHKKQ
jgi:uncharacterized membrane protein